MQTRLLYLELSGHSCPLQMGDKTLWMWVCQVETRLGAWDLQGSQTEFSANDNAVEEVRLLRLVVQCLVEIFLVIGGGIWGRCKCWWLIFAMVKAEVMIIFVVIIMVWLGWKQWLALGWPRCCCISGESLHNHTIDQKLQANGSWASTSSFTKAGKCSEACLLLGSTPYERIVSPHGWEQGQVPRASSLLQPARGHTKMRILWQLLALSIFMLRIFLHHRLKSAEWDFWDSLCRKAYIDGIFVILDTCSIHYVEPCIQIAVHKICSAQQI